MFDNRKDIGSCKKKVQGAKRNRVFPKKLGFFALFPNMKRQHIEVSALRRQTLIQRLKNCIQRIAKQLIHLNRPTFCLKRYVLKIIHLNM